MLSRLLMWKCLVYIKHKMLSYFFTTQKNQENIHNMIKVSFSGIK